MRRRRREEKFVLFVLGEKNALRKKDWRNVLDARFFLTVKDEFTEIPSGFATSEYWLWRVSVTGNLYLTRKKCVALHLGKDFDSYTLQKN
jgi:hypothetical protein